MTEPNYSQWILDAREELALVSCLRNCGQCRDDIIAIIAKHDPLAAVEKFRTTITLVAPEGDHNCWIAMIGETGYPGSSPAAAIAAAVARIEGETMEPRGERNHAYLGVEGSGGKASA